MASGTLSAEVKASQDERLSKKHIQTLGYVKELITENKRLTMIIKEYEQQKLHCDALHAENEAVRVPLPHLSRTNVFISTHRFATAFSAGAGEDKDDPGEIPEQSR